MPELPEVETVVRGIRPYLENKSIKDLKVYSPKLRYLIPKSLKKECLNSKITNVQRKAKYILIELDKEKLIVIHLGMTGKLIVKKAQSKLTLSKHDHVVFTLNNGNSLIFNDVRKFGMLDLIDQNQIPSYKFFKKLGFEPLEKEFNLKAFQGILENRNKSIKSTIMDSNLIVGVGNIYANEALFKSGIHPERTANNLSLEEMKSLRAEIIKTLKAAIKAGGSTLKDFANEKGESGYFQFNFKVYGRSGEPCFKCKTHIERIKQNGRSSFVCPQCQN